jgi:hypothetical protein
MSPLRHLAVFSKLAPDFAEKVSVLCHR